MPGGAVRSPGTYLNEVGKTLLGFKVGSDGFGEQDLVMLEVLVNLRN